MSQAEVRNGPSPDRRHPHPIFHYIMGDCQYQLDMVANQPLFVQMPFWFLRGVGAPIFLNNPLSGALILTAMLIAKPWVAGGAAIGLVTAILVSMFLGQDRGAIISGGCTFHGMLCGIVCAASLNNKEPTYQIVLMIILLSTISVYVCAGLGSIWGTFGLPAFNMPFNLTMFVFFGAVGAANSYWLNGGGGLTTFAAMGQSGGYHTYEFGVLLEGVPKALSQIYGNDHLIGGILILLAMFVDSPIICIHAVLAGVVSILIAMIMNCDPTSISLGVWSYNAVLVTCSAAGFFWVPSIHSSILALFSGVFATMVHGLLTRLLIPATMPALAFAFNVAGFIFMAFTSNSPYYKRTPMDQITYPEEHYLKWGSNGKVGDAV